MVDYDVAVVGTGLIGSAALRHLADLGVNAVGIGAVEPSDWSTADGPFASHFDAGRITRIADGDRVWAELAAASVSRYADIAKRSGIDIHDAVGLAWAVSNVEAAIDHGRACGADIRAVTTKWLVNETGIDTSGLDAGLAFEGPPAGLVRPRHLAAAERACAVDAGATVIAGVVDKLTTGADHIVVEGDFGSATATRVLLATGAYGASLTGAQLALDRWPRTIVRLAIDHERPIPSLIADHVSAELEGIYWVPPLEYPDGQVMLKIGGTHVETVPVESDDELNQWFRLGGAAAEATALRDAVGRLLPSATVRSWDAMPCVVTTTTSGYPMIGWLDERVAVAVGGNGSAAKSCDEIGRLAATLFMSHAEPLDPIFDPVER